MTIQKNSLTKFSAILAATFSLLISPQAAEAGTASQTDGIALLNMDARSMSTEESPSIALLNIDARSMSTEERPSIALLNIDARSMSTEERPSIALLNIDARSIEDSDCRILIDLDGVRELTTEDGFFVEGFEVCSGLRGFMSPNLIEGDEAALPLNAESTLAANVIDLLIDEGFDLAEMDTNDIVQAAGRVENISADNLDSALDALELGLYRYDNGACGADPTGIQGLADAICRSLPE